MTSVIVDPRSAPRVHVDLHVDVSCNGDLWEAMTEDFGPGGCLLVTRRPLLTGTSVQLLLRTPRLRDSLVTRAAVVWKRAGQLGIAFRGCQGTHPTAWFRRIVDGAPALRLEAVRGRGRLSCADRLYCGSAPRTSLSALSGDERLLLRAFRERCSVGALAERVALTPERFSRAVFALIHSGFLMPDPPAAGDTEVGLDWSSRAAFPRPVLVQMTTGCPGRAAEGLSLGSPGRCRPSSR